MRVCVCELKKGNRKTQFIGQCGAVKRINETAALNMLLGLF